MEDIQKFENTKEVLSYLASSFPKCFSLDGETKPLKIGIFHDLAKRLEDDERVSNRLLRMALRRYTTGWKYLASVKEGSKRVDLDGVEGEPVEQSHAEHAHQQLKESKAQVAEQRKQLKTEQNDRDADKRSKPRSNKASKSSRIKSNTSNASSKRSNSKTSRNSVQRNKIKELEVSDVIVGKEVSVKIGKVPMPAVITEVGKDGINVQLNSGMSVKVQLEQLRLVI